MNDDEHHCLHHESRHQLGVARELIEKRAAETVALTLGHLGTLVVMQRQAGLPAGVRLATLIHINAQAAEGCAFCFRLDQFV